MSRQAEVVLQSDHQREFQGRGAAESSPCGLLSAAFPDNLSPCCLTDAYRGVITALRFFLSMQPFAHLCLYWMVSPQGLCVPRPRIHDWPIRCLGNGGLMNEWKAQDCENKARKRESRACYQDRGSSTGKEREPVSQSCSQLEALRKEDSRVTRPELDKR